MGLVHCHFQHAGDDLGGAGQAGGGRQDQRQRLGHEAAVAQDLVDDDLWRSAVDLQHQYATVGTVAVAEFGEQVFAAGQRPRRAGTEREELPPARLFLACRKAPARVLAAEAGQHRLHARHLDPGWPICFRSCGKADLTEAAHADGADGDAGRGTAAHVDATVDQGDTAVEALDRDAE